MRKFTDSDVFIHSMADTPSDIKMYLRFHIEVFVEHLLYLCLFPDNFSYDYWRKESHAYIPRVPLLKGSKKIPALVFIRQHWYQWEMDGDGTVYENSFKDEARDKGLVIPSLYPVLFRKAMKEKIFPILEEISKVLAVKREISREEYYTILSRFGL